MDTSIDHFGLVSDLVGMPVAVVLAECNGHFEALDLMGSHIHHLLMVQAQEDMLVWS